MPNHFATINEQTVHPNRRLGRLPRKSDVRSLMLAHFLTDTDPPPTKTSFWVKKTKFTPETWGNDEEGCCTIAKQANMFRRFQRIEHRATIEITQQEVHTVYRRMTDELYGGGDTGAYEEDALSRSRNPDTALRDTKLRPLTIDAFLRINPANQLELKRAVAMAAGHGIAICINLPVGFSNIEGHDWDFPDNTPLIGDWLPGSWGGHSMWAIEYDPLGLWLEHTWGIPPQRITWRAAAAYIDESHTVIDSVDSWRRRGVPLELDQVVQAVNDVSRVKILSAA
jgi:hypothetical protein